MPDTSRQYPAACGSCKEEMAFPVLVRTVSQQPGHLEIKLRCRKCGHEWEQVISTNR
jgi:DNA-directed RNA polymerase subunit M/transcription elongation factor TFIIS